MKISDKTRTFGALRAEIFRLAGVKNHFEFCGLGEKYEKYWDKLNREEYERGYKGGEYEKSGSPQLCDIPLLSQEEYDILIAEIREEMQAFSHYTYPDPRALKHDAPKEKEKPVYHSLSDVVQNGSSEDVVSYLKNGRKQ
jgi:hypothetical protein